jgi:hypothetical protein
MNKYLVPFLIAVAPTIAPAADWLQFGYDQSHSGVNTDETTISADNVSQLVLVGTIAMPSSSAGSIVFLSGVTTAKGPRDLLFASSGDGIIFAFDAADGSVLWSHSTPITNSPYGYPTGETSTPAIDPNRSFVYHYGLDGKIHKYAVATGDEVLDAPWPVISTLKGDVEHGAAALAFSTHAGRSTYLYGVTSGYNGDGGDYQGHLTTINVDTGTANVFNTLCSNLMFHLVESGVPGMSDCTDTKGGIWGRAGSTYDPSTDRVYITSANGHYDANMGGWNWGDSVLALAATGTGDNLGNPIDSYTPIDYAEMDLDDIDLGSGGLTILPTPATSNYRHLGSVMGKDHLVRLLNLEDMSGSHAPRFVGGELQIAGDRSVCDCVTPQGTAWVDEKGDGSTWLFQAFEGETTAYKLVVDASGNPSLSSQWSTYAYGEFTTAIVANDVLFASPPQGVASALSAYAPTTGQVLWSAPSNVYCCGWGEPIAVNGHLYVMGNGVINVFALDSIFKGNFEFRFRAHALRQNR